MEFKFFVGFNRSNSAAAASAHLARLENYAHGDIVFIGNGTLGSADLQAHTLEMMRWVLTNKGQYRYLVKVDDDTFVHPYNMQHYLYSLPQQRMYLGKDLPWPWPPRKSQFRYMQGGMYALSMDLVEWAATSGLAKRLYDARIWAPTWEDVMVGRIMRGMEPPVQHFAVAPNVYDGHHFDEDIWQSVTMAIHPVKDTETWMSIFDNYRSDLEALETCAAKGYASEPCRGHVGSLPVIESATWSRDMSAIPCVGICCSNSAEVTALMSAWAYCMPNATAEQLAALVVGHDPAAHAHEDEAMKRRDMLRQRQAGSGANKTGRGEAGGGGAGAAGSLGRGGVATAGQAGVAGGGAGKGAAASGGGRSDALMAGPGSTASQAGGAVAA